MVPDTSLVVCQEVEDSRGSWERTLPEKTAWHLFSKQPMSGFTLKGTQDFGVFNGFSVLRGCWCGPTSYVILCTAFMWFLLCKAPSLTLLLCRSIHRLCGSTARLLEGLQKVTFIWEGKKNHFSLYGFMPLTFLGPSNVFFLRRSLGAFSRREK